MGKNSNEEPKELVDFMKFIAHNSYADRIKDSLIQEIQSTINSIKADRAMEDKYMLFEELLKDEYNAGKAEGELRSSLTKLLELLSIKFSISADLQSQLTSITDIEILNKLFTIAAKAESIDEFIDAMNSVNY